MDWGRRRIGLALSDELGLTVRGLPTLERRNRQTDLEELASLIAANGVRRVVVGDPRRLDGSAGASSQEAARFARALGRRSAVPVELLDERLTSHEAERRWAESKKRPSRHKGLVDQTAAVILLEDYLASLRDVPPPPQDSQAPRT